MFQEIVSGIGWLREHRTAFLPNALCIWILLILAIDACCFLLIHTDNNSQRNPKRQTIIPEEPHNQPSTFPQTVTTSLRTLDAWLYRHIYWPLSIGGIVGGIACLASSPIWLAWSLTLLAWILISAVLFVLISHARQPLKQVAAKIQSLPQKLSEHTFWNITFWSICAIILFFVFVAFLTHGDFSKLFDTEAGPRLVTTAIAMLGIITAAGALVMKYQDEQRKRADEARKNRDEQRNELSAALERMGSNDSAMSRLAGVHTLVDVADKYEQYRAEVVRILCAYLRSDHSEDDPAIESAVLESLQDHYTNNKPSDCQWSNYPLDIHGATIRNPFVFTECRFKSINLNNTLFQQRIKLSNCKSEEIETNNIRACQDINIINTTTQQPWEIKISGKTVMQNFTIINCQISQIIIFENTHLSSIYGDKSEIGRVYLKDATKVDKFNLHNHCQIQNITIGNNCKMNLLYITQDSRINTFKIQDKSNVNDISFSCGKITTLSIENDCKINNISTTNGRIDAIEIYNGTINNLYIDSSNEIGAFRQKNGRIVHLNVPENFLLEFSNGIIENIIIHTNKQHAHNNKTALEYFRQYSANVHFHGDKSGKAH